MEKSSEQKYPIADLLSKRQSIRAYSTQVVEREKIRSLFEAARWAPSSMNEQPWYYVYATQEQPEAYASLLACLAEANQVWASKAPVLMVSIAKNFYARHHKPSAHAWHDVGAANMSLCLQAVALGLQAHPMGGFDAAKVRETLALPEGYDPVIMLCVGYPGSNEELPEPLRTREQAPRERWLQEEFAFEGTWKGENALSQ